MRAPLLLLTFAAAAAVVAAQPPPPAPPTPRPAPRPAPTAQGQPPRDAVPRNAIGTGKIIGRVIAADTGAPLRRAQVRLSGPATPEPRLVNTDTEGNFAFTDLPAGTFMLSAQKSNFLSRQYGQKRQGIGQGKPIVLADGQTADRVDFALTRAGVISGRVTDDVGEPVASVTVQAIRPFGFDGQSVRTASSTQTDDLGQFRLHSLQPGEYVVAVSPRSLGGGESVDRLGYGQTFYPSVPSMAEATRVQVQAGLETPNVTIGLLLTRLARVSGIVIASGGAAMPRGGNVQMRPHQSIGNFGAGGSSIRPDGTFVINNVAPGSYLVEARSGGSEPLFATAALAVNGDDVTNVALMMTSGATIKGRIVFEGGEPPAYRGNVVNLNAPVAVPGEMSNPTPARVAEDWSFEVKGLFGKRMLRANSSGWTLKSITVNGSDVTDSGVEFKGTETVDGFEIKFSKAQTGIEVTVTDRSGQPASDYVVLLYSTDRGKWDRMSRFIRLAYPNPENRVILNGIPPGEYFLVATEPQEAGFERNPQVLEELARGAERMTIYEGEKKTQTLRYSPQ